MLLRKKDSMKENFRKFLCGLILFILFPIITYASGTANFNITSPSTFYVGDELSVTLNLTNVDGYDGNDYLTYLNSRLTYDATKLEYVSGTTDISGTVYLTSDGIVTVQISTTETTVVYGTRIAVVKFRGLAEAASTQIGFSAVTAKAGSNATALTTNTDTLNVGVLPEESTNNNLKSLTVKDNSNKELTLSPAFDTETLSYYLDVPYTTKYIKLTPVLDDTKATYKITGSLVLVAEEYNEISITVTSESGLTKKYELSVYREEEISEDSSLKSLSISGYDDFEFDPTRTTYTLYYTSQDDLDLFDLSYEKTHEQATVVVDQPNILEDGSQVKLVVTAEDEETSTTYTLRIKLNAVATTTTKAVSTKHTSNPSIIGIILIGVIVAIAVAIVVLLIILKKGGKPKDKNKPKEDNGKTKVFDNNKEEEQQDIDKQIEEENIDEEDNEVKSDENKLEDEDDEPTRIFD